MDYIRIEAATPERPACVSLIRKPDSAKPGDTLRFEGQTVQVLTGGERLGKVLESRRDEMGLSMGDVAAKTDFREDVYFRIEIGINIRPSNDVLGQIADALNLNIEDLKELADRDRDDPVEKFV